MQLNLFFTLKENKLELLFLKLDSMVSENRGDITVTNLDFCNFYLYKKETEYSLGKYTDHE